MGFGNKYPQSINAELDLHGFHIPEALEALDRFLEEAQDNGYRYVRVVTGKGLHSQGGRALLREAVKDWLHTEGFDYRYAKQSQGGEGALVIVLF